MYIRNYYQVFVTLEHISTYFVYEIYSTSVDSVKTWRFFKCSVKSMIGKCARMCLFITLSIESDPEVIKKQKWSTTHRDTYKNHIPPKWNKNHTNDIFLIRKLSTVKHSMPYYQVLSDGSPHQRTQITQLCESRYPRKSKPHKKKTREKPHPWSFYKIKLIIFCFCVFLWSLRGRFKNIHIFVAVVGYWTHHITKTCQLV